jgi:hypothetical protein
MRGMLSLVTAGRMISADGGPFRSSHTLSSTKFALLDLRTIWQKILQLSDTLTLLRGVWCSCYLSRDAVSAALHSSPRPT